MRRASVRSEMRWAASSVGAAVVGMGVAQQVPEAALDARRARRAADRRRSRARRGPSAPGRRTRSADQVRARSRPGEVGDEAVGRAAPPAHGPCGSRPSPGRATPRAARRRRRRRRACAARPRPSASKSKSRSSPSPTSRCTLLVSPIRSVWKRWRSRGWGMRWPSSSWREPVEVVEQVGVELAMWPATMPPSRIPPKPGAGSTGSVQPTERDPPGRRDRPRVEDLQLGQDHRATLPAQARRIRRTGGGGRGAGGLLDHDVVVGGGGCRGAMRGR